jgi:hypothetical protein
MHYIRPMLVLDKVCYLRTQETYCRPEVTIALEPSETAGGDYRYYGDGETEESDPGHGRGAHDHGAGGG